MFKFSEFKRGCACVLRACCGIAVWSGLTACLLNGASPQADAVLSREVIAKIAGLEPLAESLTEDWLVHRGSRKSGVFRTSQPREIVLDNGLLRRSFLVAPNLGCIEFKQLQSGASLLRSIRPEGRISINQREYNIGGLRGQSVENFLQPKDFAQLSNDPAAFQFENFSTRSIVARFPWKPRKEWISVPVNWPAAGIELQFRFRPPTGKPELPPDLRVVVHYEMYDGIPLLCKWMTIENGSRESLMVTGFTSEILACVEASSQVEDLAEPFTPSLHVETDFTNCSMHGASAQTDVVHWSADPEYPTQVNYRKEARCLLECRMPLGPNVEVGPNDSLDTFRTWILAHENRDETRQALALCRMYQTIAPWVNENPLIHHVRSADPAAVRLAIEQSAAVGFELVLMTFGSGFNIENESPEYLKSIRELADEAHRHGIALGGYSLLASRTVSPQDDVVNPATGTVGGFARFGNSPCLESAWGQAYFKKLYAFYEATGCDVLEHDGSYPGDVCASQDHPGHTGLEDSRWKQWQKITRFYRWCRSQGIYLNVPDWYFLNGSNKVAMGYRETNWSLPREEQEIIERQNIHDGTRYKLPTMGWMFVPLTEYHGGGAAATIEPLDDHRDHYERRLQNLFGAGVQACFRGPRLYDTPATKEMVNRWVQFYKRHRAILDSAVIPLRRADGRDWDGLLHVNPELPRPALAVVYNPLDQPIDRQIKIPLYYSGLHESVICQTNDEESQRVVLDREGTAILKLTIPPRGMLWLTFSKE